MSTIQRILRHLTTLAVLCLSPLSLFQGHTSSAKQISLIISLLSLSTPTSDAADLSAGKLRSLGESALMERDYATATSYYRQAIELEPNNAVNWYKLFSCHKRQRLLADALDDITNAVIVEMQSDKTKSGDTKKLMEYREQKAKLLVGLGRCEEAIQEFKLLDVVSESRKNDLEKAMNCAQFINMANASVSREDWNSATHELKEALNFLSSPSDAPDLLFLLARSRFHIQDYYGAISDTGKLLKAYPQHLEAYALRGESYWMLNEVEMAGKHFREGLKLDPEHDGECYCCCVWLLNV
jgi:tetratricopeptide (TPR) repeat protein